MTYYSICVLLNLITVQEKCENQPSNGLHNVINYDNELRRLAVIGGIMPQVQLAIAALPASYSCPSRHC